MDLSMEYENIMFVYRIPTEICLGCVFMPFLTRDAIVQNVFERMALANT